MSAIGLRVGPFEIVETALVPEPGDWYRAVRADHTPKKPQRVLVRLLPPDAEEAERAALQRACRRLRAVADPRVPRVVGLYEGIGALVLDAPDGVSFQEIVDARADGTIAMTPATLLDLGLAIAETLQHAHHRNHHHGHLGAPQVRISLSGKIHLFGFSQDPDSQPDPAWSAPERARSEPSSPFTDQWSLAAILAGLVLGRTPWFGDRDPRDGVIEPLIEPVEEQWPSLARVLRQMLAPSPHDRYPSMHAARQHLLALAKKAGSSSDRRELGKRMARRVSRRVQPDTGVAEPPRVTPAPRGPTEERSDDSPPLTVSETAVPNDPTDPPSLPEAGRADPLDAPPKPPLAPLADEPLEVVAPEQDGNALSPARRPLDSADSPSIPVDDEEDVSDEPTVRFDPLAVRDLLAQREEGSTDPNASDPDAAESIDDPQTLARALAVDPDEPVGGMPTAVPITDVEEADDEPPAAPIPIDRPPAVVQARRAIPPTATAAESAGPDIRTVAPWLVGAMVVLMAVVLLVSYL